MNGKGSEFAHSYVANSLFVGRTTSLASAGPQSMCEGLQSVTGADGHDGNGCIHAMHLPGIGSELDVANVTFVNFEAPLWTCSWCIGFEPRANRPPIWDVPTNLQNFWTTIFLFFLSSRLKI